MSTQVKLKHSEIFDDFWIPYFSRRQRKAILKAANHALADSDYQPNIAVVVRTKNDRDNLSKLIKHILEEKQNYKGRIDLVVVDTESSDGTLDIAKKAGAKVVPIAQAEFSYPKSINQGLKAVKDDVEATFITVGHALPITNNALRAAARHFKNPKVIAVYADAVPYHNATWVEKTLFYLTPNINHRLKKGAHRTSRVHGGLTQATNCMVRMKAWRKHKFDEAYGHGGEDLAWGRWALKAGHSLIYEPAVAVHHSHGLGFINFVRQVRYWAYISLRKGDFKHEKVTKYRPDLR